MSRGSSGVPMVRGSRPTARSNRIVTAASPRAEFLCRRTRTSDLHVGEDTAWAAHSELGNMTLERFSSNDEPLYSGFHWQFRLWRESAARELVSIYTIDNISAMHDPRAEVDR